MPRGDLAIAYVMERDIGAIFLKQGLLSEIAGWIRDWEESWNCPSRPEENLQVVVFEPVPQAVRTLNALIHARMDLEDLHSQLTAKKP